MRRWMIVSLVVLALGIPAPSDASDEGCQAQNPLQPTCSYTVTHTSTTPVTGVGGIGDWVVVVRRGPQKLTFKSLPDGRPTMLEISFRIGDKVTATAVSPGAGLTVGHFDP